MKRAGCYRIPFGIESGSPAVLKRIQKGITIEQARKAVRMAREAGLETESYFMIGLPGETEEDLKLSTQAAIDIDADYAKFAITVPLPGTQMFTQMEANGQILTRDWTKYNFSTNPRELYNHDNLSWEAIGTYETKMYRAFYFRPSYVLRTLLRTIRNGTLFAHIKAFFSTRW